MNDLTERVFASELTATWQVDLDYMTWARFADLLIRRGLEHVASDSWATEQMTFDGLQDHALSTLRDRHERTAILDISADVGEECVVHVSLRRGHVSVFAAARSLAALAAAKEWVRDRYPVVVPTEEHKATVTFWSASARGPCPASRRIDVPTWTEVTPNYPAGVRTALDPLMSPTFRPEHGQLILWHGVPGTGKTYALRALAWEWRSWCRFHYITDPEVFFGENARYMLDVLLQESDGDDDDGEKWRLLILEDTGELLVADAKERTGQGLSRLLNVVDGLIGQGLRLLVLVTTNEVVRRLHPAVARPGRCSHLVEFTAFAADEAASWLERHGSEACARDATLATLYARAAGVDADEKQPIGFTA